MATTTEKVNETIVKLTTTTIRNRTKSELEDEIKMINREIDDLETRKVELLKLGKPIGLADVEKV